MRIKLKLTIIALFMAIALQSCEDAGTLVQVSNGEIEGVEIYKYWISQGDFIYVAKQSNSASVSWKEKRGKSRVQKATITKFPDGSYIIQVDSTENK